jgi:hypothetical protein
MPTLVIALSDILLDQKKPTDVSKVFLSQALSYLYIYIMFKKIDLIVNTGLDFEDAYQTAISLLKKS